MWKKQKQKTLGNAQSINDIHQPDVNISSQRWKKEKNANKISDIQNPDMSFTNTTDTSDGREV